MNRWRIFFIGLLIFTATGCQGSDGITITAGNPTIQIELGIKTQLTHLWGYYDVHIDIPSQTAMAILNRNAMFTANVVKFINAKPANLGFHINSTPVGPDYVDVDIDVSITHPFPGLTQYNGYDVRGVFMGDGSVYLNYNTDLAYPILCTDQIMLPDPDDGFGGADGYTRWFNKTEFSGGGMPLFQYTPGKAASPGFNGDATLNAYKYFADGLGKDDNLWYWLNANADQNGVFSSGATNTRNYYLRFPNPKGIKFGYAITANWGGVDDIDHPSNTPESIATDIALNEIPYYVDELKNGGNLGLTANVFNWFAEPLSTGVMEDYRIFIESTAMNSVYQFTDDDMTAVGGSDFQYTYEASIPCDNVTSLEGNEFWVIIEHTGFDYGNDFGVANLAENDTLASYFRFPLPVSPVNPDENHDPVCDFTYVGTMPVHAWNSADVQYDADASYDEDLDDLTFLWDFDGDGIYGDPYTGEAVTPTHTYTSSYTGPVWLKLDDGNGGVVECSVDVEIHVYDPDLFHWLGSSGSGSPMIADSGSANLWAYLPSPGVWDESGSINTIYTRCDQHLWVYTPEIEIPDSSLGTFDVILKVVHWGGGNGPWYLPSGFDSGGFIGYKIDSSDPWTLNSTVNTWLTYFSGNNFNAVGNFNLLVGGSGCWCSTGNFPDPAQPDIWNNRCFGAINFGLWGNQASPWTSQFKLDDSLKGESVSIGFYWSGLEKDMGKANYPGWCIKEIHLYVN